VTSNDRNLNWAFSCPLSLACFYGGVNDESKSAIRQVAERHCCRPFGLVVDARRGGIARCPPIPVEGTQKAYGACSRGATTSSLGDRRFKFMSPERLNILYVTPMPASPPRFGAQARMHGLMTELARRHDLTAAVLVDDEFDAGECRRAMQAYCGEVVMIPNPYGREGLTKRLLQLRSLASTQSFERLRVTLPALQQTLDRVLRAKRFDVVNLEFPYLGRYELRQAPPGERLPPVVVDSHEIAYDLARQFARAGGNQGRRLYAGANWRKLRR
jgi:hypothetical protein